MKQQAYCEYANTGLEWPELLPKGWGVSWLKWTCRTEIAKADRTATDEPYLGLENIESWTGRLLQSEEHQPTGDCLRFGEQHVIFGKLRPYLAKAAMPPFPGRCSGEFLVLRPTELNRAYLFRYLTTTEFIARVDGSTYGAKMPRADWRFIGHLPVPRPPLPEQRKIADFLDRETDKIDRLIAEKEKLVERLEEKRKAVISQAVTQGLNPDAKMRDSGVPWLGRIPEHWQIKRLRFLGNVKSGCGFPQSKQGCPDGELPFYKVKHLGNNGASLALEAPSDFISMETALELGAFVFPPQSVVFAKIGAALMLNRFRLLERDSCIDNNMMGFTPFTREVTSEYAAHLLSRFQMRSLANPGAVPSLNVRALRDTFFPVPDPSEQQDILKYVGKTTASINDAAVECSKTIGLLQERRAALISAAVTGRLNVQEVGA